MQILSRRCDTVLSRRFHVLVDNVHLLSFGILATGDREKSNEFQKRLASGESMDDLLVEAFAVVREAAWRVLGLRHYDVQVPA